ncbi:hypothetical protein CHARACLAT_030146 [Characodon lateralis]|uniref:Uncharacterized protein n=1 Tax=Characodon lateralis TaxID=208331 RepID=A0ABU7EEQ9_9TELE|nr:hypothetical protein [Characodon lateralis]
MKAIVPWVELTPPLPEPFSGNLDKTFQIGSFPLSGPTYDSVRGFGTRPSPLSSVLPPRISATLTGGGFLPQFTMLVRRISLSSSVRFMEKREKKSKKEVQKTIEKIKKVIVEGGRGMDDREPLGRWLNREYKRHLKDKESWLIKADEKGGLGGRKCKVEAKDAGKRETEWGRLLVWWQGLIHYSKDRTQEKQ